MDFMLSCFRDSLFLSDFELRISGWHRLVVGKKRNLRSHRSARRTISTQKFPSGHGKSLAAGRGSEVDPNTRRWFASARSEFDCCGASKPRPPDKGNVRHREIVLAEPSPRLGAT